MQLYIHVLYAVLLGANMGFVLYRIITDSWNLITWLNVGASIIIVFIWIFLWHVMKRLDKMDETLARFRMDLDR